MKSYQLLAALGLATVMTVSSGCRVSVSSHHQAWYDVYGYRCGTGAPSPGCNFYADGSKIYDYEDPYYSSSNTYYYGVWDYYNSYGYPSSYFGWAWQSPDGIIYDEYGYALNNNEDQDSSDLIADVAKKEEKVAQEVGKTFAAKYALSESKGIEIAKNLNSWATLSLKLGRARNAKDLADFSQRMYGVSVDQAQNALAQAKFGDVSGIEEMNTEVAEHWGTSPETSKVILKRWYKDQLSEYGVK